MKTKRKLTSDQSKTLLEVLQIRFEKNLKRHRGIAWVDVRKKLEAKPDKLWSLDQMESTGGEPDVVAIDKKTGELVFMDCSAESPKGRRSICYDHLALESRKENKPANSAMQMAEDMGITLLSEEQYRDLQQFGPFDAKTSSWILTPADVRQLGGALFCDYRFGKVFVYHNGAESYYAARGFRGCLRV